MYKKLVSLLLIIILLISLTACNSRDSQNIGSDDVVSPSLKEGNPEITILYYEGGTLITKNNSLKNYIRDFKKKFGVEVNLKSVGVGNGSENDMENFYKKINAYMHEKRGPELILVDDRQKDMIVMLTKQSIVVDVREKVANIKKIYDNLLGNEVYYVPIGMDARGTNLNGRALKDMGIKELGAEWEYKDYAELKERWLKYSPRYFTTMEFNETADKYLWKCKLYDENNKVALINTSEVSNAIKSIRKEIYSNYLLNKNYTYENYYNMIYEPTSKEAKDEQELVSSNAYKQQSLYAYGYGISSRLYARQIQEALDSGLILMPDYKDIDTDIMSYGFLVNKNGNNVELAFEFINGLLANDVQLEMWQPTNEYQYYPVNKEIEKELLEAEQQEGNGAKALDAKAAVLNRIKADKAHLYVLNNIDNAVKLEKYQVYERLKKQLIKYIFADTPYSDEELSSELKKLEEEYTIWLNE